MIINNTGYSSVKIFCESKSSNSSATPARKQWSLQNPIVLPNNSDIKMLCSVESCSIPLSYYTVNNTNNKIKVSGVLYTLAEGNYDAKTIVTELETIQSVFTATFSKVTSRLKLQAISSQFTIDEVDNNAYDLLGIVSSPDSLTLLNAPHPLNLVYTSGLYLSLNNTENNNIDTGSNQQSSTALIRIPINQPTNTYLGYFNPIGFKNLLATNVLNQIDLSLLDDNRKELALTSNVNWVVVLRIDFEKDIVENQKKTTLQSLKV